MLHWYTGRADAEGQVVSGGVPHRSVSKRGQGEARRLCKPHNLTLASHKCSTLCLSVFFSASRGHSTEDIFPFCLQEGTEGTDQHGLSPQHIWRGPRI